MKTKTTSTAELKKRIIPVLKSHGIFRASLFGSAARGELRKGSDIDLLIDTKGKLDLFAIVGLKQALEHQLSRPVDLVEYKALKPTLRAKVLAEQVQML